uniref:C-C motif chemokine n=1 Tax=Pygocentrus nattereri TaxID=42514 RepID=A0A3B4DW62_PYGNA
MIVHPRSLLLGLLVILYLQSGAVGQNSKSPKKCCFSFYTRPIPVADITQYEETDPHCTRAGVIFTTKRGVRVCVDPGFKWVKRAMDKIDRQFVEYSS